MLDMTGTKHTKWSTYTAIVCFTNTKWYANIFKPVGNTIESHIKQGSGYNDLIKALQQFNAPNNLTWLDGNGS